MYKKIFISILITLSIYSCSKSVSSKDSNFLFLSLLNKDDSSESSKTESKIRKILINEETMENYGNTIFYGNDTKCTEDLGIWGQTRGPKKCIVEGKMTKLEYVKKVIKIYIDKMKANGIDIVPVLKKNSPSLLMFNKPEDKETLGDPQILKKDPLLKASQDLQANETFVIKDAQEGFSSIADAIWNK